MKKITLLICLLTVAFASAQLNTLAIVGSGTAQGWPADPQVDAHQFSSNDGENWTITGLPLVNGAVKFRGNNSWALPYNWGGTAFPAGTASVDDAGITAAPGVYDITFNSTTGVYSFELQTGTFPVMGLIGTATAGGWDTDTDMATIDGINYFINGVALVPGAIKFRQDHTWTPTTNWGGNDFPSGTGIVDGGAITVPTAGTYNVTFNKTTLQYNFFFSTIALVGAATPNGWPTGAPGEVDPHQLTTTDGVNYTLSSISLIAGGAKFREDNKWAKNWGANAFPSGTGVQDGSDIPCTAGTFSITFNKVTGAYNFTDILGTDILNNAGFKVYPNPTQNNWNFISSADLIKSIQLVDISGKTIFSATPQNINATIDSSGLSSGIYFAKVATVNTTETIKLIKN